MGHRSRALASALLVGALFLVAVAPVSAGGQSSVAVLRAATAAYHDIDTATAAGYTVEVADLAGITCIADPGGAGVMGIHFLKPSLLDASVNAATPELLIYEPRSDGSLQLIAVEYLVLKAAWEGANGAGAAPPELFGRQFHLTLAGNRYGLPDFYEIHAWVWKPNPSGMFSEWNPTVSCGDA